MKLRCPGNSRNLGRILESQAAAYSDLDPFSGLCHQTSKSLRTDNNVVCSARGKQPPAARCNHIFECMLQICCHIERPMKGHFERSRLLDQKAHAVSVYGSIGLKNPCDKPAHTKRSGVFKILLHECELIIGIDEISSTWAQNRIYRQATLRDGRIDQSVARC